MTFQYRLQELSSSNEENPDLSDIELIQHINVDTIRLIKLLNGEKKWWKKVFVLVQSVLNDLKISESRIFQIATM